MPRKMRQFEPCEHCGSVDIIIQEDKDMGGYVAYCGNCKLFPPWSFVNRSSAKRGWDNYMKKISSGRK